MPDTATLASGLEVGDRIALTSLLYRGEPHLGIDGRGLKVGMTGYLAATSSTIGGQGVVEVDLDDVDMEGTLLFDATSVAAYDDDFTATPATDADDATDPAPTFAVGDRVRVIGNSLGNPWGVHSYNVGDEVVVVDPLNDDGVVEVEGAGDPQGILPTDLERIVTDATPIPIPADQPLPVGSKVRLIDNTSMAAQVGATATVNGYEFSDLLGMMLVNVTWDDTPLRGHGSGTRRYDQSHGEYPPSKFEVVTDDTPAPFDHNGLAVGDWIDSSVGKGQVVELRDQHAAGGDVSIRWITGGCAPFTVVHIVSDCRKIDRPFQPGDWFTWGSKNTWYHATSVEDGRVSADRSATNIWSEPQLTNHTLSRYPIREFDGLEVAAPDSLPDWLDGLENPDPVTVLEKRVADLTAQLAQADDRARSDESSLRASAEQVRSLNEEVLTVRSEVGGLLDEVSTLKAQIEAKDAALVEALRLGKALDYVRAAMEPADVARLDGFLDGLAAQ